MEGLRALLEECVPLFGGGVAFKEDLQLAQGDAHVDFPEGAPGAVEEEEGEGFDFNEVFRGGEGRFGYDLSDALNDGVRGVFRDLEAVH